MSVGNDRAGTASVMRHLCESPIIVKCWNSQVQLLRRQRTDRLGRIASRQPKLAETMRGHFDPPIDQLRVSEAAIERASNRAVTGIKSAASSSNISPSRLRQIKKTTKKKK